MAKPAAPETPALLRVWPHPRLSPLEDVPGIPAAGIDLTPERAQPLLDAHLVTTTPPPPAAAEPEG